MQKNIICCLNWEVLILAIVLLDCLQTNKLYVLIQLYIKCS